MHYLRFAAGLAVALPVVASAASTAESWTGCYGGASGGYEFHGRSDKTNAVMVGGRTFAAQPSNTVVEGAVGGVELGCNIQVAKFVFGPELAASYQDVHGTSDVDNLLSPGETVRSISKSNYIGTASMRLGYTFNKLLVYGRGGVALTTFKHSGYIFNNATQATVDVTSNGSKAALGYIVGGGGELALNRHWSVKLEYNYLNFGSVNIPYSISLDPGLPTANVLNGPSVSKEHEQIVRAGFNYRF